MGNLLKYIAEETYGYSSCRLSLFVNCCKPMSTGFDFVAIKNPVHPPR